MTKPFSMLKKQVENLFLPSLKTEVCCVAYPVRSQHGSSSIPRFFISMCKAIIWDFPKQFPIKDTDFHIWPDMVDVSQLLRDYIDTPLAEVPTKVFEGETVTMPDGSSFALGLAVILKAADRRLGKTVLYSLAEHTTSPAVHLMLSTRLAKKQPQ